MGSDKAGAVGETIRKQRAGGIEQETRRLYRIARNDDMPRRLETPCVLAEIADARCAPTRVDLYAPRHCKIAYLRACQQCARYPYGQRALLGVGRAAEIAKPAINAGRRFATQRGDGRQRRRRPLHSQLFRSAREHEPGCVHLMRPIGIAPTRRPPRIAQGARYFQRLLGLLIIGRELLITYRPVKTVAEAAARLEPFGPEAKRDHAVMNCRAANAAPRIIAAERNRILAANDALVCPVKRLLGELVRCEVVERAPEGAGFEDDDGEAFFREAAAKRGAASAGADNQKVDRLGTRRILAWASSRPA